MKHTIFCKFRLVVSGLLIIAVFAACAPTSTQTPTVFSTSSPTITPTPTPTLTPTQETTPIITQTATKKAVTVAELFPSHFYAAFNNLESVDNAENFFKVEGEKLYIQVGGVDVEISRTGQFGVNVDSEGKPIHNPLASLSVVSTDGNTYGFNPETQTWFNAAEFQGSQDMIHPTIIKFEDIANGNIVRALLLDPEVNIPMEIVSNPVITVNIRWEEYGSYAYLVNFDSLFIERYYETTIPQGTVLTDGTIVAEDTRFFFEPGKFADPGGTDGGVDDLEYKILLCASGSEAIPLNQDGSIDPKGIIDIRRQVAANILIPFPVLFAEDNLFSYWQLGGVVVPFQPSLNLLGKIPGNSLSNLTYIGYNTQMYLEMVNNSREGIAFDAEDPRDGYAILSDMQKMLFPLDFGIRK
jgi:hypothetical protein